MRKPKKHVNYIYQKVPGAPVGQNHLPLAIDGIMAKEETTVEWEERLKRYGCTQEQIEGFKKVRSLQAFLDYCRDNDITTAYIAAERVGQG